MCERKVREIALALRRDLLTTGKFSEDSLQRVRTLSIKEAEDVARIYGFKKSNLDGGGSQLEGFLRYVNRNDSKVLELDGLNNLYFRTGNRMYLQDGKLNLACPLEQKIHIVEVTNEDDISKGVNTLLNFVKKACPTQKWYSDDADKILLFERNVARVLK